MDVCLRSDAHLRWPLGPSSVSVVSSLPVGWSGKVSEGQGAVGPAGSLRLQLRRAALETGLPSFCRLFYFIYFGYPSMFIVANQCFQFPLIAGLRRVNSASITLLLYWQSRQEVDLSSLREREEWAL